MTKLSKYPFLQVTYQEYNLMKQDFLSICIERSISESQVDDCGVVVRKCIRSDTSQCYLQRHHY